MTLEEALHTMVEKLWREYWVVVDHSARGATVLLTYPYRPDPHVQVMHLTSARAPHFTAGHGVTETPLAQALAGEITVCPRCFMHAFTAPHPDGPSWMPYMLECYLRGIPPGDPS